MSYLTLDEIQALLAQPNAHSSAGRRDLLGHADVSTTEVYARADERFKREALMLAYPSPSPEPDETAWQKTLI